ncbi:MAG: hypothetical protein A3G33_01915 [Omnitrophica bacterium RIFCSPLOWO2_12_FULL_44_17]|uniref:Peptidoglycan binding-like domain-containing protein n=1 Tax=Candidatus Danuiimicrobium aquiferis TaxID=1801832 RepID=A0A1G1KT05_9BACT|nr:MAG: hypothetical protein A3B72_04025 [Omnitrophica bacterium RIFCSPHIGHO2_02_FULL_45_28]OGW89083.1 MAG: hypothetical protein A3E74_05530 [Omnitrophica bacterium RIFCSPHIGHO2_12_FULL_44_12]OGW96094.1 MAG: hypothetical protein A3G33_01915 [Omnitrophica bacterium RIFCSPLOWO2_12_FULL_44_17]OGX02395.1 MAG: hypothetical protein A3J12_05630 [Omnitrophica bacterium RIFCSPLOWO2_02_FULL_44_11]
MIGRFWPKPAFIFGLSFILVVGFVPPLFAKTEPKEVAKYKLNPAEIQKALNQAGLYTGSIDGIIGAKTRRAIREFQSQNGLLADGVCGPKTWEKLKTHLSGKFETSEKSQNTKQNQNQETGAAQDARSSTMIENGLADDLLRELEPRSRTQGKEDLRKRLIS